MSANLIIIIEEDLKHYRDLLTVLIGHQNETVLHFTSVQSFLNASIQQVDLIFVSASVIEPYIDAGLFFGSHYQQVPTIIIGHSTAAYELVAPVKNIADAFILIDCLSDTSLQSTINTARHECKKRLSFVHSSIDYKRFFEQSPCPMWVLDIKTLKFLDANPAVAQLYGYTKEEFLALSLHDLRNIDDSFKATFTNRPTDTFYDAGITLHKRKNGEPIFVHIYSQNLHVHDMTTRLVFVMDTNAQIIAEQENSELNKKIKKQKERLEQILASVNDVVWSRDRDFKLTYINPACLKVFGYLPDELIGHGIENIYPDDVGKLNKEVENTITNGTGRLEYRIIHKDGSVRSIITNATAKKDEQGCIKYFTGISVDMTEMRAMEEELEKYTIEIENILESIRDGFFTLDRNWNFVYVNKAFEQIFQCNRKEIIGTNYWEKFENAKHQKFYVEYHRAYEQQIDVHFEEYATSLNKWVSVSVYPSKEGITVYFTDITEEKQLKEKVIRDEYNLRSLINNTKDLIWSIDNKYRLISANDAYCKTINAMTGMEIISGDSVIMNMFDKHEQERWLQYYSRALNGESFKLIEKNEQTEDSQYVEINFTPMYDNNNAVIGCCCMGRNITEQRRHLLQIETQNKQLKEIAWMQSHQVRAPLATILGLISLLKTDSALDCDERKIIDGLKTSAEQLDNIIKEIVSRTNF